MTNFIRYLLTLLLFRSISGLIFPRLRRGFTFLVGFCAAKVAPFYFLAHFESFLAAFIAVYFLADFKI